MRFFCSLRVGFCVLRLGFCGCCFLLRLVVALRLRGFFCVLRLGFCGCCFFGFHGVLCTAKFVSRLEAGVLLFGATFRDSAAVIAPCP